MRRIRYYCSIAVTILIGSAGPAAQAEPVLYVPAPVQARKSPVPAPEPKPPLVEAKQTNKAAAKKAADQKKKDEPLAKVLFSAKKTAVNLAPRAIGWYSKGCLAGGVHLEDFGSAWQTMRPSRNRAWGHPKLIRLLKRLAVDAQKKDGWPGLLVGDIAQPRGGPMITGHASHQVGLDADIWLNPMPDHKLTYREREDISAKTMLDKTQLKVDPNVFTDEQFRLIKRAASYAEVQRIFVHPAIKKALCEKAGKDRHWLTKVRPLWGHHYHFHIRIYCPNAGCKAQDPIKGDDGCGKEVDNWLKQIAKSLEPPEPKPGEKKKWIPPSERRKITMDQLPAECRAVLNGPAKPMVADDATLATPATAAAKR